MQNDVAMREILAENWHLIALTLAIAGIWFYRTFIAPLMRENDLKAQIQSMAKPVLILQAYEGEEDFLQRAERAKEQFRQSGNKFAQKQCPVIAVPFNGWFEIVWFGERHTLSTVGMGQMEYLLAVVELYKKLYLVWAQKVYGAHGEQVYNETVNQQKPFGDAEREYVWSVKREN